LGNDPKGRHDVVELPAILQGRPFPPSFQLVFDSIMQDARLLAFGYWLSAIGWRHSSHFLTFIGSSQQIRSHVSTQSHKASTVTTIPQTLQLNLLPFFSVDLLATFVFLTCFWGCFFTTFFVGIALPPFLLCYVKIVPRYVSCQGLCRITTNFRRQRAGFTRSSCAHFVAEPSKSLALQTNNPDPLLKSPPLSIIGAAEL